MPTNLPITFTQPVLLWLLLLIPAAWWLERKSLVLLPRGRRRLSFLVRSVIIGLLVFALAGMRLQWAGDDVAVVFALDRSESVGEQELNRAISLINQSSALKRGKDKAGLVVFGDDALVERSPSGALHIDKIESVPSRAYTDLSKALRLAVGLLPDGVQKRVVLFTDGNENVGSALTEAQMAAANDVVIDVVPLKSASGEEVLVESVQVPEFLEKEKPFDVKITIQSTYSGPATLRLYKDRNFIGQNEVNLTQGKNIFLFPQQENQSGFHTYEAMIDTVQDTVRDNNQAVSYAVVFGEPRVLLVGAEEDTRFLQDALKAEKIPVDVSMSPPANAAEAENYDAVFLCNVSAETMSAAQLKLLQGYCGDLGGGLAMIGGQNSFGLGGYRGTPVEEAMPVSMEIKNKKNFPSLGLVICVDKSGSMASSYGMGGGKTKLELAAEAGVAASSMLTDRDYIGVVGFDSAAKWDCPWQRAENKEEIRKNIQSLRPGGGTDALPALHMASDTLGSSRLQLKHVILISDGMVQPGDYDSLINKLRNHKITLTSVAVGDDADRGFMERIAVQSGGRFYFTNDPNAVPRIFTKETVIAQRSYLVEEEFVPKPYSLNEIAKGISALPPLHGYVSTEEKDRAETVLKSHKGDVVLAVWRYRLGKSLAWTSDARDRWGRDWVEWGDFKKFWGQAGRWVMRNRRQGVLNPRVVVESGKGKLMVDAVNDSGEFVNLLNLDANVMTPTFETKQVKLRQTAAGHYEAEFDAREVGTYLASVGGEKVDNATAGVSVSYSPEYLSLKPNQLLMHQIAAVTGGQVEPPVKDFFRNDQRHIDNVKELWYHLLWAALVLLLYDIGVRRVFLDEEQRAQIAAFFRRLVPTGVSHYPTQAAAATLGSLKARRERVRERISARAESVSVPGTAAAEEAKAELLARLSESRIERPPVDKPEAVMQEEKQTTAPTPEAAPDRPAPEPGGYTSRLLEARKKARERTQKKSE